MLQAQNYEAAVEILKTSFEKKQSIINAHMSALLELKEQPNDSTDQQRKIYHHIKVHMRRFDFMSISPGNYDNLLTPVIMLQFLKEAKPCK